MDKKRKIIIVLLSSLIIVLLGIIGLSFSYFLAGITGADKNVGGSATANFNITLNAPNAINATGMIPLLTEEVEAGASITSFTVVSGVNEYPITYALTLSSLSISTNLRVSAFKWELRCINDASKTKSGTFNGVSASTYTLSTEQIILPNETDSYQLRLWIEDDGTQQISMLNGTFSGKITLTSQMSQLKPKGWDSATSGTLLYALRTTNNITDPLTKPGREISLSTEKVVSSATDDYGTSYYFRGAVTNNYVVFAGMCWRIVRVVGDGSVKLVLYNYNSGSVANPCDTAYDGTSNAFARYTGTTYTTAFNTSYNYNAYIGLMYGTPNSSTYGEEHANTNKSTILTNLEAWYNLKLASYESKLTDTIWCNDKSMDTKFPAGGQTGYGGTVYTYYSARGRIYANGNSPTQASPTLKCGNDSNGGSLSRFTVNDTSKGNGNLDYKIGLLTIDEVAYAGGRWYQSDGSSNNSTYYLYKNATSNAWWSLSPSYFGGGNAYVYNVSSAGNLNSRSVSNAYGLRPSVSLVSTVQVTGAGTSSNPYKVV